ncbi:NAD(P)/FAD-dependent oxidoreductase [Marivita sp. GX14005]|uniref:dihydrolipoyl dehydrogenase family protein n=1 Tax=Marivita sp. GX14005 TaxID=2942276 RepID=UPI002018AC5A|nr:NAD(P)/FAD-dependent oxidoreductase [Marivita sp. GX14005]MCL3880740.1 NAD(P)/FAD-dependent oxidoreductase [Marivita sp. GX14005]
MENSDTSTTFDLIVVGGGSGGLSTAIRAAELGARTALVERDKIGGTCINRGCVPKKLMWMPARQRVEHANLYRMDITNEPALNYVQLHRRIKAESADLTETYEKRLSDAGVSLIRGEAEIRSADDIRVNGKTLQAGKLALATGARPKRLDIEGADLADVSDDVFEWTRLPRNLLIVGGGYIGCEFATILNAFGVEVTLVNDQGQLIDQFIPDIGRMAQHHLEKQGVAFKFNITPDRIRRSDEGLTTELSDGTTLTTERVLLSTGRQPNVDRLGPICDRFDIADSGALAIDARFATSVENVHAIGDCADRLPLTPVATRDGKTFADQHFGSGADQIDLNKVPSAVFVCPPVAQVGTLPDDLDLTRNDGLGSGVLKPEGEICHGYATHFDDDRLCGAALVHDSAPDMISLFAALVGAPDARRKLRATPGIHPTFGEELVGR